MSEVWLARDERTSRPVAVKFMRGAAAGERAFVSRLQHPNLVSVLDAGDSERGAYVVTEFVHGRTLREVLEQEGPLATERAVRIVTQVASALQYAHARGIVHCDLKPENVLITHDDIARVTDFGAAREAGATVALGDVEAVVGTIAYMAPEVLQGAAPDPRADVYSLALVTLEMLAGSAPFAGNPAATAAQRLAGEVPSLGGRAPAVPPAIEAALAVALSPDPRDRYAGATQFASALEAAIQPSAAALPAVAASSAAVAVRPLRPRRVAPPAASGQGPPRVAIVATAVLLALGVLTAGVIGLGGGGEQSPGAVERAPAEAPTSGPAVVAQEPSPEPTTQPPPPTAEPQIVGSVGNSGRGNQDRQGDDDDDDDDDDDADDRERDRNGNNGRGNGRNR